MNHHNSYQSEKKTIQLSMILLFLALLIIYILLFSIKGETLKNNLSKSIASSSPTQDTTINNTATINNNTGIQITIDNKTGKNNINTTNNSPIQNEETVSKIIQTHKYNTGELDQYAVIENGNTTKNTYNNNSGNNSNNSLDNTNNIHILSGTQRYYGPIKIIEKLGIKYEYALKDEKNIYYIYLGHYDYDFDTLARLWSGNVYKMTEQAIIKNNLFGEQVSFINLPDYQNQTVIMLIKTDKEKWLIQIDYNIYHQSKQYLKKLFGYE